MVSSFPEGTQLSLNAVTVENGAALVDLSIDALRASGQDKLRMREQLTKSLASVATVSSVSITVEGTTFTVPDPNGSEAQQNPDVDARPLVVRKGAAGYASSGSGRVAELGNGLGDLVAGLDPTSFSLSASGTVAVVGNGDGVFVVRGRKPVRVDQTDGLVAPSIDDLGFVWVASAEDPRKVTAYGLNGDPHPITTTLPAGRLVSFQMSRDSTRALALVETNDGPSLYVMGVIRGSDRTPTAFGSPVRLQAASGIGLGATWISDSDVASMAQTTTGPEVVRTTIGGQSSTLPKPDGRAASIAGGSGGSMLLRMADGQVLQSTGGGWVETGSRRTCSARSADGAGAVRVASVLHRRPGLEARPPSSTSAHARQAVAATLDGMRTTDDPWADALRAVVGLLLPVACAGCHRRDHVLCPGCRSALDAAGRHVRLVAGVRLDAAFVYDGLVRTLLLELKLRGRVDLARPLARRFGQLVRTALAEAPPGTVLVRIPPSRRGARRRGFDPVVLLLARGGVRGARRTARLRRLRAGPPGGHAGRHGHGRRSARRSNGWPPPWARSPPRGRPGGRSCWWTTS